MTWLFVIIRKLNLQRSLQKEFPCPLCEELCLCYKWHQMTLVCSQQSLYLQQQTQPGWKETKALNNKTTTTTKIIWTHTCIYVYVLDQFTSQPGQFCNKKVLLTFYLMSPPNTCNNHTVQYLIIFKLLCSQFSKVNHVLWQVHT